MSYNSYILARHQLAGSRNARIVVGGHLIIVESSPCAKKWTLRTELYSGREGIPSYICESVSASGTLRWQERGAYLKWDPATYSVHLVQEIHSSGKYAPFRHVMHDFASLASQWREALTK